MCVCVCEREREREGENRDIENTQDLECIFTKEKDSTTYKVGGGCFI